MASENSLDLSIGELAKRSRCAPSAIRYYESVGLVRGDRTPGGQRRYGEDALLSLRYIAFAKAAGFTLSEITALNDPVAPGHPLFENWKELADRKLQELDEVIERAKHMKKLLRFAIDCRCTDSEECGLLSIKPRQRKS